MKVSLRSTFDKTADTLWVYGRFGRRPERKRGTCRSFNPDKFPCLRSGLRPKRPFTHKVSAVLSKVDLNDTFIAKDAVESGEETLTRIFR